MLLVLPGASRRSRATRSRRPRRGQPICLLLVLIALCVISVPASGSALSWRTATLNSSFSGTADAGYTDVKCVSLHECIAVGDGRPVYFNGTRWTAMNAPATGQLNGVSCAGARDCMAVGRNACDGPLIERWHDGQWTALPVPGGPGLAPCTNNDSDLGLSAVSCSSLHFCMAIEADLPGAFLTWNGTAWRYRGKLPIQADLLAASLSCPASDGCALVGSGDGFAWWNGSSWKVHSSGPNVGDGSVLETSLQSVACLSVRFCLASGYEGAGDDDSWASTPTVVWNGHSATPVKPPPVETSLAGLSCVTRTDCLGIVGGGRLLRFNGRAWSRVGPALPARPLSSPLGSAGPDALSCRGVDLCMVVSSSPDAADNGSGTPAQTLMAWNY